MFDLIFKKDDLFFFGKINQRLLGEHLKNMTPNYSDLQFIHKESGNSMATAKWESARLLPHWRQSKQRVVVDGSFSNFADVESGVPLGTVLSPLLFLLHINNLPSCVNSKVREIKSSLDKIDMQRDALMDWRSTWGMKFN